MAASPASGEGTATTATPPVDALADELRRRAPGSPVVEVIEGERFIALPATPLLRRVILGVAEALGEAAGDRAGVEVEAPLVVSPRSVVVPDVVVHDAVGDVVLVVEVRTESTDRYALGPKRLAFQLGAVPEYWFVDPRAGVVLTMQRHPGAADLAWPPERHGPADVLEPLGLPGVAVVAACLLTPPSGAAG